ncbi:hypothetical protein ccbrp13_40150 [Ktedonobacteria bacterium brp13]|nr:hypothetical protein ccbrp13_40150 [Ktedonobacteria bacterium brp13]
MTQTREKDTILAAAERSEQILTYAGGRLGMLVGRATIRFRQAAQAFREEADHMDMPGLTSTQQAGRPASERNADLNRSTMERAEELVGRIEQWAIVGSSQMKRAIARLQEDAEDMYVEAQDMHDKWKDTREQA